MEDQRHPRRYDHVGAWFLTPQASKWGLVFTIIFGLLTARHCKKRPRVSRRLECATCIKIVRRFANEATPCS